MDVLEPEFLRRLEYLNVVARKILSGRMRADRQSVRKGVSAEFTDHRAYVPGDDIRNVDWHLFGRLEELFIKLYKEEENLHLTVLLDTSLSMERGAHNKLNYAIEVAAALAYIGMANMDSVNVVPIGPQLGEGRWRLKGRGKIHELFDFLDRLVHPADQLRVPCCLHQDLGGEREEAIELLAFIGRVNAVPDAAAP